MKRLLKPLGIVLAVLACWFAVLAVLGFNLIPIGASLMEAKYKAIGYEQGAVVLMGSSSIQMWRTSESDLGPLRSVNVGISGSVISQWMPLLDTLVAPFNPKSVIIYIGANDIHALKKTAQETMDDLKVLIEAINEKLPESKLYYIPVYQTGAHPEFWAQDIELNRLVHEYAEGYSHVQVIDVPSALLDSNNQVDNSIFRSDLLHLNDKGYAIWAAEARIALGLEDGGGLS